MENLNRRGDSITLRRTVTEPFQKNALRVLTSHVICVSLLTSISKGGDKVATVYIREFPQDLHRKAKAKAALMGISLKELMIRALTEYLKKHKKEGVI
jgi:hypothetical protein